MPGHTDPLGRLAADRAAARRAGDPWASLCVLASVDADGIPQQRVLVLRELNERLAILTSTTSAKWRELPAGGPAGILVYLASIEVQYRLTSHIHPVEEERLRESWAQLPHDSKVLHWLYSEELAQGAPLPQETTLDSLHAGIERRLAPPLAMPDSVCGLYLEPFRMERLALAADALHDRRRFERDSTGTWHETPLLP